MAHAPLTPQMVVAAYCQGLFPMAEHRHGELGWYYPQQRAVLPLERFRVRRSLAKRLRRGDYLITRDQAFGQVIRACAEPRSYTDDTWINQEIIDVYCQLHRLGVTHSVEAWRLDPQQPEAAPQLVGGLYGLTLGAAFCGESMFSRAADASKVCLVHLVQYLRAQQFQLLDTQIANEHMAQFGLEEIPHAQYLRRLEAALDQDASWEPRTLEQARSPSAQ